MGVAAPQTNKQKNLVDEAATGQVPVQVLRFPSQFLLHKCSNFIYLSSRRRTGEQ